MLRPIYTDGRKHPVDPQPAWLGYSVGAWAGDTRVVETRGFTDKSWLDAFGHPRSRYSATLIPDTDLPETVGAENERDAKHLVGK